MHCLKNCETCVCSRMSLRFSELGELALRFRTIDVWGVSTATQQEYLFMSAQSRMIVSWLLL